MIAPDRDRRLEIATLDKIIDRLAHLGTLAVTEPADTRRQSLKVHTIARQTQPAIQRAIVRKHLQREIVSLANVLWITRQRHPAKRSFPFAEERANVLRHEARYLKCILATRVEREIANVVAVIDSDRSHALQRDHCFDVSRHRL